MLDQPSRSDITTSSRFPSSGAVEAQGFFAAALEGLSAIYALAAKVTFEGLEDLADRRAERRAERPAKGQERDVVTRHGSSRSINARQSTVVSAPKRAPKSR
jgi:hypothetical protein